MNQHLILVDFPWSRDKDPRLPLGHASLLAALAGRPEFTVESAIIPVNGIHGGAEAVAESLMARVKNAGTERVDLAFGAYVWCEGLIRIVLQEVRRLSFTGRVILGGPQISYAQSGLELIYPEADAFIRGYGEKALYQLLCSDEARPHFKGVHWAGTDDTGEQAEIDLPELPSPYLNGLLSLDKAGFVRWETQRGCPYNCAFCQHQEPGKKLKNGYFAWSRLEAEIDLFCRSGIKEIAILDPVFNRAPHAIRVLKRFAHNRFQGCLSLQCRAESITPDFLNAAGELNVVLEFGLQTIHTNESQLIQRPNDMAKIEHVLAEVRRRRIKHEISLIFGLPRQTLASFEESIRWCLDLCIPVIKAFPLMLLRGTRLEQEKERWDLQCCADTAMPLVRQSRSFSCDDWLAMAKLSEALNPLYRQHSRNGW